MRYSKAITVAAILTAAAVSFGQPTMDSLWPNEDGTRWEYLFHVSDRIFSEDFTSPAYLQFSGTSVTPGGPAQVLLAGHDSVPLLVRGEAPDLPPLLARIWLARPDLRETIRRRYAGVSRQDAWWPLFLHGGNFVKTAQDIGMLRHGRCHRTWLYLEDDIVAGATFSMQLVPDLANDICLHGTVAALDATVSTPAGTFDDAVQIDYLLDFGIMSGTDDDANEVGTYHAESVGHVHYVPGLGPVHMREEFWPMIWADCGDDDCPWEWQPYIGVVGQTCTLSLTRMPVSSDIASWGAVKALYR